MLKYPRVMIAGTHSGVGKTTITLSIMAALNQAGYEVQPFKVGPDYIDPSHHKAVTQQESYNLDTYLTSPQQMVETFYRYSKSKDIAVIEGVMGLFDGYEGVSNRGSSGEVAALLQCPVILVIDARSMARSVAALAQGFINFSPDVNIAGLIINNVASDRHQRLLAGALSQLHIPVLGYVGKNKNLELKQRHLGLIPSLEGDQEDNQAMTKISEQVVSQLALNDIIQLAKGASLLPPMTNSDKSFADNSINNTSTVIAIAKDKAFNFYYPDGLAVLEELGAKLVYFSPLADKSLPPNTAGVIIGGGFPELYLEQLAANREMHQQLKTAYQKGMPFYAECGGYMYLSEGIYSFADEYYPMVGLVPTQVKMGKKLAGMGYRAGTLQKASVLGQPGAEIRGHEFHYSTLTQIAENFSWALHIYNSRLEQWVQEGYANNNLVASYLHIHWRGNRHLAQSFYNQCVIFRDKGGITQ